MTSDSTQQFKRFTVKANAGYQLEFVSKIDIALEERQRIGLEISEMDQRAISSKSERNVLGGRGQILFLDVQGWGAVAIKGYYRGGILGRFNRRWHFRDGKMTRAEHEFAMLELVRSWGVSAPQPLAHIRSGNFFYRAWLVTAQIAATKRLTEIEGPNRSEQISNAIEQLVAQVNILIAHNILHIDLHPGNVLVGDDGAVTLLDFDKAKQFAGSPRDLRDSYLHRWRRAVIKHRLPELYAEHFALCVLRRPCVQQKPNAVTQHHG